MSISAIHRNKGISCGDADMLLIGYMGNRHVAWLEYKHANTGILDLMPLAPSIASADTLDIPIFVAIYKHVDYKGNLLHDTDFANCKPEEMLPKIANANYQVIALNKIAYDTIQRLIPATKLTYPLDRRNLTELGYWTFLADITGLPKHEQERRFKFLRNTTLNMKCVDFLSDNRAWLTDTTTHQKGHNANIQQRTN
jgi:hypothetical protein